MKTIVVSLLKGGVGKTSLVYHLAWMFADMGKRVIAADLDPQANLTAAFLEDDEIEEIWNGGGPGATIYQCVKPLTRVGDIEPPKIKKITQNLYLIPGDVSLSGYEDVLSAEWAKSMGGSELYRPMRILSSFWQVMQMASEEAGADIILADIGPNLGAINRSALIAADYVVIPLGADLFSLQGLKNLGPVLREWTKLWKRRLCNWEESKEKLDMKDFELPGGLMKPVGYLCQQAGVRLDRPVVAYDKWVRRIPLVYRESVLNQTVCGDLRDIRQEDDPYCLAVIKHYRGLIAMAQEKRKPVFKLTSADGAIGSHANAVRGAYDDFKKLAADIADKIGMSV